MRMICSWRLFIGALSVLTWGGGALAAQNPDTTGAGVDTTSMWENQRVYEERRAQLVQQLHEAQSELSNLRSDRVRVEARVDNVYAQALEQRARTLLMSPEQSALLQLDSMLASAQDRMQDQRERMQALGDAVRRRSGAVLVVLLGADSLPDGGLGDVKIVLDSSGTIARSYSQLAIEALQHGAVDEIYRGEVLPTSHDVWITATLGGAPVERRVSVAVKEGTVTYLQFSVRNGQLVPSTWTSRGTSPF
ncbi:MAG TPA: hypothetical protein VFK39_05970 [Gemmatimonadaceae bacterium]|nr:hypothetical protein [Gemmatimonadaceae bacterium]